MTDGHKMRAIGYQSAGLEELAKDIGGGTIVEIGSYIGEGAVILSRYFDYVYAIDCWEWDEESVSEMFSRNYHDYPERSEFFDDILACDLAEKEFDESTKDIPSIRKMKGFDYEVVDKFMDGSLDAIYIDSIHSYQCVMNTIRRWMPKIRDGGHLCGHDYSPAWPGVRKAVDEMANELGTTPNRYKDGSWCFKV